jgi:hypothetical protein
MKSCLKVFLGSFWAFLGKGGSKTPQKSFCKESMSENFFKANRQKFRCQFFLDFFLFLSHIWVFFSAMGIQKHYKKHFTKRSCRKVFTKKSTKNPKPTFSRFFITFLGVSRWGAQKHDKKYRKNLTNQTRQGPSFFVLSAP